MFGHGDLKFVVLNLLAEKPRHGYEIIKELEDRFGGAYSPSPGTVYPTLSLLEDLGYARAVTEEGNRKVFEITDEGRKYLEENRSVVDDIFGRVDEVGAFVFGPTMAGLGLLRRAGARHLPRRHAPPERRGVAGPRQGGAGARRPRDRRAELTWTAPRPRTTGAEATFARRSPPCSTA
jgi:DNA-binding PadR family transcriptional regulator